MKLSQCRLRIVNYFDDMINEVDLKSEVALSRSLSAGEYEFEVEQINQRREAMINQVRQIQAHNLAYLDRRYKEDEFKELSEIEIDRRIFNKFCFMIDALKTLSYSCFADRLLGYFVVVDRFVGPDTLAAFKELLNFNRYQQQVLGKNLLFESEQIYFEVASDVFRVDTLMIETTQQELFRLKSVKIKGSVESIKEPARVLFQNIERLELENLSSASTIEFIEVAREMGQQAEQVHISCHLDEQHESSSSMFTPLSDLKIKSLCLLIKKNTTTDTGESSSSSSSTEPFHLNVFLPLTHLEELKLNADRHVKVVVVDQFMKPDMLRKLHLNRVELDAEFIESMENLNEIWLTGVKNMAELFKKKQNRMQHVNIFNSTMCEMREIESHSFQGLQSLTSLFLRANLIQKIHEHAFGHLTNLTHLDLSSNRHIKLESGALDGLTSLQTLRITYCEMTSLDENIFANLASSLTHLDLCQNKLTTAIYRSISCLSKLKVLNLECNLIDTIESSAFGQMVELETLNLSVNSIKSIDSNAFQRLTKLEKLSLNKNQICNLHPDLFKSQRCLKILSLMSNVIKEINTDTFSANLTSLEQLELSFNPITLASIQAGSFAHLSRLKYCDLSGWRRSV